MNRKLFALARDNDKRGSGIRSEATDADTTTIYVYDVIDGFWGVSAADFARELSAAKTDKVVLRINSPGGDVFEARAMMTAIAEHPATFTAKIDGLAASAATALTLACDTVEIADGGFYMIHQAWTFAMGNADDMTAAAGLLAKIDDVLVAGYTEKSGKSDADVRAAMKAETWYGAQEAVDAGFADSVIVAAAKGDKDAKAQARIYNFSAFANVPKALTEPAPAPEIDDAPRRRALARMALYERPSLAA